VGARCLPSGSSRALSSAGAVGEQHARCDVNQEEPSRPPAFSESASGSMPDSLSCALGRPDVEVIVESSCRALRSRCLRSKASQQSKHAVRVALEDSTVEIHRQVVVRKPGVQSLPPTQHQLMYLTTVAAGIEGQTTGT
jgi:hypothetical protein